MIDHKLRIVGVEEVVILAAEKTEHTQHGLSSVICVLGGVGDLRLLRVEFLKPGRERSKRDVDVYRIDCRRRYARNRSVSSDSEAIDQASIGHEGRSTDRKSTRLNSS